MAFIEAQDVVKDYSGHRALDGLSLSVPEGCVYGLLGPNGAGKTTFIRILNQITRPDSGTVLLNGHKLRPDDVYGIGYMPEERGLYKKMKVGEEAVETVIGSPQGLVSCRCRNPTQTMVREVRNLRLVEQKSRGTQQRHAAKGAIHCHRAP